MNGKADDSISRQGAIEIFDERREELTGIYGDLGGAMSGVVKVIKKMPSAESEIIQCKDCKNFRRWIDTDITFCDLTDSEVCEKDFCSRAERRKDE